MSPGFRSLVSVLTVPEIAPTIPTNCFSIDNFSDAKVFKRSALGTGMDSFVTGKTPRGPHAHELSQQGLVINDQTIGNTRWGVPDVLSSGLANKYLSKIDPRLQLRDNGALANLLDTASVATSIPGSILLSQDASFRNITYRAVVMEHARRRAKQLAGPNATSEAIDARYRELLLNVPEDIHRIADLEASISVFQEPLKRKGWIIEPAISQLEKLRNIKFIRKLK